MDGRDGRPRDLAVLAPSFGLSSGDPGVTARTLPTPFGGGVSSGSDRRTHDVGERKPISSFGPGVTACAGGGGGTLGVMEKLAARTRDLVRALRVVEADKAGAAVGVVLGGLEEAFDDVGCRRLKPDGPFLTILPILSSVVLMRAWRSCNSLKPLVLVVCDAED